MIEDENEVVRSTGSGLVDVVGVASSLVVSCSSGSACSSPSGEVTVTNRVGSLSEVNGVASTVCTSGTVATAAACSGGGDPTALAVLVALLMAVPIALAGDEGLWLPGDISPERREAEEDERGRVVGLEKLAASGESKPGDVSPGEGFSEVTTLVADDPEPVFGVGAFAASLFFFSSSSRCRRCCSSCSSSDNRIASITMS